MFGRARNFFEVNLSDNRFPERVVIPHSKIAPSDGVVERFFWWEKFCYQRLGPPIQQIRFETGNVGHPPYLDLYNWVKPLSPKRYKDLHETVSLFASEPGLRDVFKTTRYILLTPRKTINPYTGFQVNGLGGLQLDSQAKLDGIEILQHALSHQQFRFAGMTRFKHVLIHELSHKLAPLILEEWCKKFNWENKNFCGSPERCVTSYACNAAEEDICESMVALIAQHQKLDKEKAAFLSDYFFSYRRSLNELRCSSLVPATIFGKSLVTCPKTPESIPFTRL